MADGAYAALELDPAGRAGAHAGFDGLALMIGGSQRIGGEKGEDVGQEQLLVLLLVVDADLDQPADLGAVAGALGKQLIERLVHVRAVSDDALCGRSREQPAVGARLPGAERFVIGIETIIEGRIEFAVARAGTSSGETSRRTR